MSEYIARYSLIAPEYKDYVELPAQDHRFKSSCDRGAVAEAKKT